MKALHPTPQRSSGAHKHGALLGVSVLALVWLFACGHAQLRYPDPLARCTHEGDCEVARARCDAGDVDACLTLGYLHGTATEASAYHQPALGESYLVRACRLSVLACYDLVHVARTQRGECEGDHATETKLVEAACGAGYPAACAILADKLVEGVDVARDTERAARLYASACDAEDRFPAFTYAGPAGTRVPAKDPLAYQVMACVRARRLSELGLAGSSALPRTTPDEAARVHAARAARYQVEERVAPEVWIEQERKAARWLERSPAELRESRARDARSGILLGCRSVR